MTEYNPIGAENLEAQYQDKVKETIYPQELLALDADGIRKAEAADGRVDGTARLVHSGGGMRPDETSDQDYRYDPASADEDDEADDIQYKGLQHHGVYYGRTPEGLTAPTINHGDVVGIAAAGAEAEGRLVPEGYTHDGTTYGRSSAGEFVPVGIAYLNRDLENSGARQVSGNDVRVRFQHRVDLN